MRLVQHRLIHGVADIDLPFTDGRPRGFPAKRPVQDRERIEETIRIAAPVVKVRHEERSDTLRLQRLKQRGVPAVVRGRLAERHRASVEGAEKRSAVLLEVGAVVGVLFDQRQELGWVGEMGHVEGEEELESTVGASSVEQRLDRARRPAVRARDVERKGVEAGRFGVVDVLDGFAVGHGSDLVGSQRGGP